MVVPSACGRMGIADTSLGRLLPLGARRRCLPTIRARNTSFPPGKQITTRRSMTRRPRSKEEDITQNMRKNGKPIRAAAVRRGRPCRATIDLTATGNPAGREEKHEPGIV